MEIKVIDNFLPQHEFERLRDIVMSPEISYYYQSTINSSHEKEDLTCYFTHHLFNVEQPYIYSNCFHHFRSLFYEKLEIKALIRMKINLYPRTAIVENHVMHRDYPWEQKGCVFSFNTCDGATLFEDGTRIDSVANRALLFNAHDLHGSTSCTNAKARFNININYF
jgi:hypothetical protein